MEIVVFNKEAEFVVVHGLSQRIGAMGEDKLSFCCYIDHFRKIVTSGAVGIIARLDRITAAHMFLPKH